MAEMQPPSLDKTSNVAKRPWYKKWWIWVIVGVVVVATATNADQNKPDPVSDAATPESTGQNETVSTLATTTTTSTSTTTSTTTTSTLPPRPIPADQQVFLDRIESAKGDLENASNTLQRADALTRRDSELCNILEDRTASDWVGKVTSIGANREGKAYIEVEIADGIKIFTWNNALSDAGDNTLIPPGSALYQSLLDIQEGNEVRFTAVLMRGDDSCLKRGNITITFYGIRPEFLATFKTVTKL